MHGSYTGSFGMVPQRDFTPYAWNSDIEYVIPTRSGLRLYSMPDMIVYVGDSDPLLDASSSFEDGQNDSNLASGNKR